MSSALRRADARDLPGLHALIERAYRGDAARAGWTHEADLLGGQRTDPQALGAILADSAQAMLITADADGALIGCVHLRIAAPGHAYLGMLTVDPRRQASGLGRAILTAAEAHARDAMGARTIEMTVIAQRRELIAWYERRGWRLTGERRPFPIDDPRFGLPRRRDLAFVVLARALS